MLRINASESYWKATFVDNYPDCVARYDRQYKHLYVNQAILNETGLTEADLIGKSNREVGIPNGEEVNKWEQTIQQIFISGQPGIHYTHYHFPFGTRYYHTRFIPEFTPTGEIASVLAITREITESRNFQKKLQKSRNRLKEKNKELNQLNISLDNFFYIVAHDLQSPLHNLQTLVQFLQKETNESQRVELLLSFQQSLGKLLQTVGGLTDTITLRDQPGLIKQLAFQPLLNEVLAELLETEKGLPGTIEADFSRAETIHYPEAYLQSIIKNLVSNALKYRSPERPLQLIINTRRERRFILLSVTDNGIGIDLERHQDKLFQPFKRFTSHADGKGLGLHILKSLVEKNGGHIEIESQLDDGTSFLVYLAEYPAPEIN